MGSVTSTSRDAIVVTKIIDKQLDVEAKAMRDVIKLLLLGASKCGKSTVLKQMRILHDFGFSKEEVEEQKSVMRGNVIQAMGAVVKAMGFLNVPFSAPERMADAKKVLEVYTHEEVELREIQDDVVFAIKRLWKDSGVKACLARSSEFRLNDTADYFLNNVDRICAAGYVPRHKDMLMARRRTNGVVEVTFHMNHKLFRVIDVGGQTTTRRKWIHHFDRVDAIIFIVAVSEYNQYKSVLEKPAVNRLAEVNRLFANIINCSWFRNTPVILFLNKIDVFMEKIQRTPINIAYPDFEGIHIFEESLDHVKRHFLTKNKNETRDLYTYTTCATDSSQMQRIIDTAIGIIISKFIKSIGFQ